MSLDSYANLKLELIDWSHRDDLDLKIDTFIDMAESKMYANETERLELKDGDTRATASMDITSRYLALPNGYQSMRKLRIQIADGESYEVMFRTPAQLNVRSDTGMPSFFTVTSQLEFDRVPDQAYTVEMQYFADFSPLSDTNASNAVLTNHPEIYLFGSLWALKNWTDEEQDAARYWLQFTGAIKGANKKARRGRYGPAPVMRVEGCTP